MTTERLSIVCKYGTIDVRSVLEVIRNELNEMRIPSGGFALYDERVDLSQVWPRLKKAGRKTFDLAGQGFEFHLAVVRNYELDFLTIQAAGQSRSAWDRWIAGFATSPSFVMAWLADAEYEYWQNVDDPLEYTSVGRPHDHLPKRCNNLPPPLDQLIIDTAGNPGRRLLRVGYYEVVGALMWLGEPFWTLTKANKNEVEHSTWLKTSRLQQAVVRVEACERSFATSEGIEGDLQRRLRDLLYTTSR